MQTKTHEYCVVIYSGPCYKDGKAEDKPFCHSVSTDKLHTMSTTNKLWFHLSSQHTSSVDVAGAQPKRYIFLKKYSTNEIWPATFRLKIKYR